MIRHSHSFAISLSIHITIAVVLFLVYTTTASYFPLKEEKIVCIKLGCVVEQHLLKEKKQLKKEPIQKKIKKVKQVQKKVPHKEPKKKVPTQIKKKTIPIQKEIVKQKVIEESTFTPIIQAKKAIPSKEIERKSAPVTKKNITNEVKKVTTQETYVNNNLKKIIELLKENLYYPRRARKRRIEGEVLLKFTLATNAKISNIQILSSEHDILSRAAIKTVENLSLKFPKPKEKLTLTIPINYTLK